MNNSTWLNDDQLREIALSLIFEERIIQRLEHLHQTYSAANGLEMFDSIERELEAVKQRIDAHLWRGRFGEEDEQGNVHWLTIEELRERTRLPTHFDYPRLFPKATSIGWHDVEKVRQVVALFKLKKETEQSINNAKERLASLSFKDEPTTHETLGTLILPAQEPTEEDKRRIVRNILAPLNGLNPTHKRIMREEEFIRLVDYTDYLVTHDALPTKIQPIRQTGISDEHIRYTFYRLHKELFTTKRVRQTFIDFLHTVFVQFSGVNVGDGTDPKTTRRKFSIAPSSYVKDFDGYIGEVA